MRLRYAQDDNSKEPGTAHMKELPSCSRNLVCGERRCQPLPFAELQFLLCPENQNWCRVYVTEQSNLSPVVEHAQQSWEESASSCQLSRPLQQRSCVYGARDDEPAAPQLQCPRRRRADHFQRGWRWSVHHH